MNSKIADEAERFRDHKTLIGNDAKPVRRVNEDKASVDHKNALDIFEEMQMRKEDDY